MKSGSYVNGKWYPSVRQNRRGDTRIWNLSRLIVHAVKKRIAREWITHAINQSL